MSPESPEATPVVTFPSQLISLWRDDAAQIDEGTKPGSHLKATVLRICASQLDSVLHEAQPKGIIDTSTPTGLITLSESLIGTIVTPHRLCSDHDVTAWVRQFDATDGKRYWCGTQRRGVSLTTAQLARDYGPMFERLR